jgi:hypothetical protein
VSAHTYGNDTVGTNGVVNQALRREVNERISSINNAFQIDQPELMNVLCECIRPRCTAYIAMSVTEYELIRRFPTRFFVKAGHEIAEDERIVDEADGYVVIEAGGRGGVYAVGADPRSPYRRHEAVRT